MKRIVERLGKLALVACLPFVFASPAFAQATRTWVSGVGDDANPCSRTAPCKTFAGAISKTAAGGEISVLDPGGFGGVTITKAITLNGEGTLASILVSGTNGIVVNAPANAAVIIRNLSIDGVGAGINGINFIAGGELHVENVAIFGFTGHGIAFQPSGASALFVDHTTIRNATTGAVLIAPGASGAATATLNGVAMDGNGRGLRAEDGSTVFVRDSSATGNVNNGFVVIGATRHVDLNLENCLSSGNGGTGVYSGSNTTVKMSNTMVTNNQSGLNAVSGGGIVSFGNNRVISNVVNNGPATVNVGQM